MTRSFVACVWGWVFGLGLGVAGLTRADTIQGALDVTGDWNPALFITAAAAASVYQVGFRLALRLGKPPFAAGLSLPTQRAIDGRLVLGAALFGAGWGLAGMCPGATLVALPGGDPRALVFMFVASAVMATHDRFRFRQRPAAEARRPRSDSRAVGVPVSVSD